MLGVMLEMPFESNGNGNWRMPIGASNDSAFTVRFHRPGHEEHIIENPFEISSYLNGVQVESALNIDAMLDDMSALNTLSSYWDSTGPLGDLLTQGQTLPNPFYVTFAMNDIYYLIEGSAPEGYEGPD